MTSRRRAAGGGVNLAVTQDFSIEASAMYEGMPDVKAYPYGDREYPVEGQYGINGLVFYLAIGWHF